MLIGIDFDNTIAGYDSVFRMLAEDEGFIPPGFTGGKQALRDFIRCGEGGEKKWQRLQGRAYGERMAEAELVDGVADFLIRCREDRLPVCIISHKTEYGHFDPLKVNLREAAQDWMTSKGFFASDGFAVPEDKVFFEGTREEKITRISGTGCTHFIDDLAEVLMDSAFPGNVTRFWFNASSASGEEEKLSAYRTWREISDAVFASLD